MKAPLSMVPTKWTDRRIDALAGLTILNWIAVLLLMLR